LAQDPQVEVLVFKMAVATGFDAPRASTLCALRPVVDAGFGLQVIGRIMRVHPLLQPRLDLPAALNTGYVFLGDAVGQVGLQAAADRVRAIRDAIEVCTDSVSIYVAAAGADGEITVEDEGGQRLFVLTSPIEEPGPQAASGSPERAGPLYQAPETLFDQLAEAQAPSPRAPGPDASPFGAARAKGAAAMAPRPPYSYPMRPGLPVPKRLLTEKMPANMQVLVNTLVDTVTFTPEHRAMVRQLRTDVERRETDLFDAAVSSRTEEQAAISELFAQESAFRTLRVSDHIDPQDLARRLLRKLQQAIERAGEEPPDQRALRRGLNVILVRSPTLCREALRRAMGTCTEVVDAADLPETWDSAVRLEPSKLNLYGCMPSGLNTWEAPFADWLDRQAGRVLWWLRNLSQPRMNNAWAVRIVLPETGAGFFPDFVICVDGRKKPDGIALADTKERIAGQDGEAKSRTEHRAYGRALILTYDTVADRFTRVEFDPALGRNREVAAFEVRDLLD
jgi:type III restriction enzyme